MNKPQQDLDQCRNLLKKCGWSEPIPKEHLIPPDELESFLVNPKTNKVVSNGCLPPVNSCLTAWDEWVWPVLREKGYWHIVIIEINKKFTVLLLNKDGCSIQGEGTTKIAALVMASMEALW